MTDHRVSKVTRVLGAVVGGGFTALGFAELATRIDEPLPLLFWLPTLWGGAALVLAGVFVLATRSPAALAAVIAGAFLGTLASFWTIVMPLLAIALVTFATIRNTRATRPALDAPALD